MKYTTIRIEGAILSADILDKIEQGEIAGQLAKDFGFDPKTKVKDEVARAWADAQDLWRIFNRQKEKVVGHGYGTTETRKFWMVPLLGLFGYDAQLSRAETVSGKSYAISHRAKNLDGFPIHIVGFNDSLDRKREEGGTRMSPHALLQEYINLNESLYAVVTNGFHLRLLRDSSRLIKLSFIEFDIETMMEEEHFADFAIMYRLLHSSRMPVKTDLGADSLIEKYHQDALDSGSRIREGLSQAVEISIRSFANGFLNHPDNVELREKIDKDEIKASAFYQYQLRLIYRLLFLMVIEERNLVFPANADKNKREIYYEYYSVNRLRKLCEKRYLADQRFNDLWIALKNTFHLFENETKGKHLGIRPLAGDLFGYRAIGILNQCRLDNKILLECLRNLNVFINKNTGQKMRVNYASLNVEEFGSVYEGLLEYGPVLAKQNGLHKFDFVRGTERSSSGSHYTPDELVQPLIRHSLDYVIKEKLASFDRKSEKEKALLSIKVCDVACGSGHILLNAARRIGTELAKVRTSEDQPSPTPLRQAVRDVIKNCIYGVDINPLAVELCKVALWLEAHNPGEPLNFLDHHIKCGDAIVGLAHKEELENGISDEAFKKMPDDDKDIRAEFAKRNKKEKEKVEIREKFYLYKLKESVDHVSRLFDQFNSLPENTVDEIEQKRNDYQKMTSGHNWWRLKALADIQVAQFFIPKNEANANKIITDAEYRDFLGGRKPIQGPKVSKAIGVAQEKRFFHYFLEFPEVFAHGGFDCILGNPPYLGGQALSGNFGHPFLNWVKTEYSPAGSCDLVTYFLRRIFDIISQNCFLSILTTNTISQGNTREGGLDVILKNGGSVNFAIKSMRWPGQAAVIISIISIYKGKWEKDFIINNKKVEYINSFLDEGKLLGLPYNLPSNSKLSFMGSTVFGKGFFVEENEAKNLLAKDEKNKDVLLPILNGHDLLNRIDQSPSRYVINFYDMPLEKAKKYKDCYSIVENKVKPQRLNQKIISAKEKWWLFHRLGKELYETKENLPKVLSCAITSKTLAFEFYDSKIVFSNAVIVFTLDNFYHFALLQSTIHNNWAWKYASTLKTDLRYTPSDVFETFPFPQDLSRKIELEKAGETYHDFRRQLMLKTKLGLTKTYNLFHTKDLKIEHIVKVSKQPQEISEEVYENIIELRNLHKQMDQMALMAYGWEDIDLAHDFYEVEYLPENDRIRYTISPDARKELLKRLLKQNHEIYKQEQKGNKSSKRNEKNKNSKKEQKTNALKQIKLF